MERFQVDVAIIGSGVVGLAMAEALSLRNPGSTIVVIERHQKFGQEASSHNSEVVHAGIYYKNSPQKARFCVLGNRLLYKFCEEHNVPVKNCGKYVVATSQEQLAVLDEIYETAKKNGADIFYSEAKKAAETLKNPQIVGALWSPSTGIVDSHVLMEKLLGLAQRHGVIFLYGHELQKLTKNDRGYDLDICTNDQRQEKSGIQARTVINAGGLAAAQIAQPFFPSKKIEIRPCRGRYFSLSSRWTHAYTELVYPVPDPAGGLGVHITFDMSGKCRLGPDVDWDEAHRVADDMGLYQFSKKDESVLERFFLAGKKLIPELDIEDLSPDYIGVRCKLFIDDKAHNDFLLMQSAPSDWHLLGIESPGLTAALALADHVSDKATDFLNHS